MAMRIAPHPSVSAAVWRRQRLIHHHRNRILTSRPMLSNSHRYYWKTNDSSSFSFVESNGDYRGEADLEDPTQPLYAAQASLPRLPVPSLEETIDTFLPTALPLVESKQEMVSLQAACRSFPKQAADLQKRLLRRSEEFHDSSWLQQWWNQLGYLQPRHSNAMAVSYFFRLADDDSCESGLERSAAALQALAVYGDQVLTGQKPADSWGRHKHPIQLCSTQYKYLFAACRIPAKHQDKYRIYQQPLASHAVVAVQGQFYKIPVKDNNGMVLSRANLCLLLQECIRQSYHPTPSAVPELGWLTATNRDDWAAASEILNTTSPQLKDALEALQSALCIVCLDFDFKGCDVPQRKLTDQEQALRLWHGNKQHSSNRWFDKSIQLSVNEQGQLGYIGEHSMADGMPAVGICQSLLQEGAWSAGDPAAGVSTTTVSPKQVTPIFESAFQPLSPDIRQEIEGRINVARNDFLSRIDDHQMNVQHWKGYGSKLIKQAGYSPDAFVQVAMQLAAYRRFGKCVATYESTQTRRFLHGRTETARSVSPQSQAFCQAMTAGGDDDDEMKVALLRQAVDAHVQYVHKATQGRGVDRHFFGLSLLLEEGEEAPDLFAHPVFERSKCWLLSTSTLPGAPGFGNVEADGVGIGYTIGTTDCIFTIAGRKEYGHVESMAQLIGDALDEMSSFLDGQDTPVSKL